MTTLVQTIPGVMGGMNGIILDVKKLDEAVGNSRYALWLANLGKDQKAAAAALKSIGIDQAQAQKFLQGNFEGVKPEQRGKIEELIRNNQKAASFTSATKGVSQTDTAQERIQKLREEIDRLNGSATTASTSLAQKMRTIADAGKDAKMSAKDISSLQKEYTQAFQANTFQEFNKALLQAQGNTQALRKIEIDDTIKGWEQRFESLGMKAEETQPKLNDLRTALEKKHDYQDMQTAVSFYDDLANLSGDYTTSLEKQNELIALQAQIHRMNGLPPGSGGRMGTVEENQRCPRSLVRHVALGAQVLRRRHGLCQGF